MLKKLAQKDERISELEREREEALQQKIEEARINHKLEERVEQLQFILDERSEGLGTKAEEACISFTRSPFRFRKCKIMILFGLFMSCQLQSCIKQQILFVASKHVYAAHVSSHI